MLSSGLLKRQVSYLLGRQLLTRVLLRGVAMSTVIDSENLFHRSKTRIKNLGEVFTPPHYVDDMLALLSKGKPHIWADEDIAFFEPTCGHGNIVISIYKKAVANAINDGAYYAVANAINTLWAIDIDSQNISQCRSRILVTTVEFLREKLGFKSKSILIEKRPDFIAHLLCAIKWHISENEALSALSDNYSAQKNAQKTKSGAKWFSQNEHHPINFDLSWAHYFENCKEEKSIPMDFKMAYRFITAILSGKSNNLNGFDFAKYLLDITSNTKTDSRKNRNDIAIVG